jgi:Grx4 family monothiol glutaredoxin
MLLSKEDQKFIIPIQHKHDLLTYLKNQEKPLSVLLFTIPGSPYDSHIIEVLSELNNIYANINFLKVNAQDNSHLCNEYSVTEIPTIILFKDGIVFSRVIGVDIIDLSEKVSSLSAFDKQENSKILNNLDSEIPLTARMFRLINSSPLMIFMKGKPSDPRCKFSRALIELLDSNNLIYETFDILIDNDIREGLKKHSHWPTYPQVYVKGVLVGGLDIVQELIASKEFFSLLPSSCYKESAKALHARLKNLIQTSKVVLFMKGTPDQPKCGFSKTMVDLLKSSDIGKFETFDVLSDEHVRQGLKEYSNWPTYPQLYVKGQLVGGVDVVKQLVETGELQDVINGL